MEVFARVVELGGFSAAARALRMTPSAISKLVGRLETRLGARLINRSTRALQLTPEGRLFYDREHPTACRHGRGRAIPCRSQGSEREDQGQRQRPGRAAIAVADRPRFPRGLSETLSGDIADGSGDRPVGTADRCGAAQWSAQKLPTYRAQTWSSADDNRRFTRLFRTNGVPKAPDELARHNRLGFSYARTAKGWPLIDSGAERTIPPSGNVQVSDGDALRALAISGVGLVRLASFIVRDDIAANRLVPVLEEFNPGDIDELHAVYLGQGGLLPIRVRVFLEFLAEHIQIGELHNPGTRNTPFATVVGHVSLLCAIGSNPGGAHPSAFETSSLSS